MGNQLFQAARKAVEKAGEVLTGKMGHDHGHEHRSEENQYSSQQGAQHNGPQSYGANHNEHQSYSSQHGGQQGGAQQHGGESVDADSKAKAENALMSAFANASPAEQKQLSELQDELKNM
jgi:hypothetical protein